MASEVRPPASVKLRMLCNVAFDFLIGLVPVIGDILDISFKANSRNAKLLESYLQKRAANEPACGMTYSQSSNDVAGGRFFDQGIRNNIEAQGPSPPRRGQMSGKENVAKKQRFKG